MRTFVCRLLIALMAWAPYHFAQAGMIATDQVVASTSQADRAAVASFVSRADVASQLQSFGVDSSSARDRVAAMTDDEVRYVAGRIDAMPAGGNGMGLVIVIVLILVVWWAWNR